MVNLVIAVAQENLRAWRRNSTLREDPSVVQKLVHTDVLPDNRGMPPIKMHPRQHPFRRVVTVDSHCPGIPEEGQALESFAQHPSTDQCENWRPRSWLPFQNNFVPGRGHWVIPERMQPRAAWHFTNLIFTLRHVAPRFLSVSVQELLDEPKRLCDEQNKTNTQVSQTRNQPLWTTEGEARLQKFRTNEQIPKHAFGVLARPLLR
jgi:hypothetical protein